MPMSHRRARSLRALVLASTCAMSLQGLTSNIAVAQTTATWLAPTTGNWRDGTRWSTNPAFPSGPNAQALIAATGASTYFVRVDSTPLETGTITVTSTRATLTHNGNGTFTINGGLYLNAGSFEAGGGGTLNTPAIVGGPSASFSVVSNYNLNVGTLDMDATLGQGVKLINGATLANGHKISIPSGVLEIGQGKTLGGDGELRFDSTSDVRAIGNTGTFSIGHGFRVRPGNSSGNLYGFINHGTLFSGTTIGATLRPSTFENAADGVITVQTGGSMDADRITNYGTITIADNSRMGLTNLSNSGTIVVNGGFLSLVGPWTGPAGAPGTVILNDDASISLGGSFTPDDMRGIVRNGTGRFALGGTLLNANLTTNFDDFAPIVFSGTISGGTISGSAGSLSEPPRGTLINVNVAIPLTIPEASRIVIREGMREYSTFTVPGSATLDVRDSAPIDGPGRIEFGTRPSSQPGFIGIAAGQVLNLGPDLTVATRDGDGGIGSFSPAATTAPRNLVNNGTLIATAGRTLTIYAHDWVNNGTLVVDGGSLTLGGSFSFANVGTLVRTANGGRVNFAAVRDLAGGTFDLDVTPVGSLELAGGAQFNGAGTITTSASTREVRVAASMDRRFVAINGPTTLDCNIALEENALIALGNTLTLDDVTIRLGASSGIGAAAGGASGTPGSLLGSGSIIFDAAPSTVRPFVYATEIGAGITARTGASDAELSSSNSPALINRGTLSAQGAGRTFYVGSANLQNIGTMQALTGATLAINGGWSNTGTLIATGGTLNLGGTYASSSLANMELNNALVRFSGLLTISDALELDGSRAQFELGGSGQISGGSLRGVNDATLRVTDGSNDRLNNLGSDVNIDIVGGTLAGTALHNLGRITLSTAAGKIQLTNVENDGTIDVRAGSNFFISTGGGSNLNRGTISASGAGTNLAIPSLINSGTLLATNGGTLQANTGLSNSGLVRAIGGTFSIQAGGVVPSNFSGGTLSGGTWEVFDRSAILVQGLLPGLGTITTNAASVRLSGPLSQFPALNTLRANEGTLIVEDGRTFTAIGSLDNREILSIGDGSMISTPSDFAQTDGATLAVELGANSRDAATYLLTVGGTASLDGDLHVTLADGFVPRYGDTFRVISATTFTGGFDTVELPSLSGDLQWDSSRVDVGVLSVVPEPSSLLAIVATSLVLRRRRCSVGR